MKNEHAIQKHENGLVIDDTDRAVSVSENVKVATGNAIELANIGADLFDIFSIMQRQYYQHKDNEMKFQLAMKAIDDNFRKFEMLLKENSQVRKSQMAEEARKFDQIYGEFNINRILDKLDNILNQILSFDKNNLDSDQLALLNTLRDLYNKNMDFIMNI